MSRLWLDAFERLPERFRKPTTKDLYYVLYGGYGDLERAYDDILESRNLEKAFGETLDKLGANVGQLRLEADDDLYGRLIQVRIIANLSIGDIPTINHVMSALVKEIYLGLEEIWLDDSRDNEPAAIRLKLSDFSKSFPIDLIQTIKSAGVRVLLTIYKEKNQKIYYGLADQRLRHVKFYPATAEDQLITNRVYFAFDINNKRITVKDKPVEVWTTDNNGFLTEIIGEGGEQLRYDRN